MHVVILAGGRSTRFRSRTSKVLHTLGGQPLIHYVLDAVHALSPIDCRLVVSPVLYEELIETQRQNTTLCRQPQPLGTGDALKHAFPSTTPAHPILILLGDAPLITHDLLSTFLVHAKAHESDLCVMGMRFSDPSGYGRCLVDTDGQLARIVEEKEATSEEKAITLCNSGVIWMKPSLWPLLKKLEKRATSGEYYLTDLIDCAHAHGKNCTSYEGPFSLLQGINTRADLAQAELTLQKRFRQKALKSGVTLRDPDSTFLSYDTRLAQDVTLEPFVKCGPGVVLEEGVHVLSHTVLSHVHIKKDTVVGPFAHLLENTTLGEQSSIGNFVEMKRTTVGMRSKVKHLSYLGDATLEDNVNVGAGTITCNYDGQHKHATILKKNSFIGANSSLVAPVEIAEGACVGAGSVITKTVPPHTLAIARAPQIHKTPKKRQAK